MINKPILTIAIPTYNRSEELEKILLQLGSEKNKLFEILISDDNSSDNTGMIVGKYKKKMKNIIYNKNRQNIGYSGNVCKLYELANTRYIWFLCDDDSVLPGGVKKVTDAIIKYEPVVAIFNCTWTNPFGKKALAGVEKDIVYDNIKSFKNYQALMRATFLSILVVEKRCTIDPLKKLEYKNNIFFQLTLSVYLLSNKFKFCEIGSLVLHRNVGYKYGEFFKFYLIDYLKAIFIHPHKFDNRKFIVWSIRNLPIALQLYLSQKIGLFKYHGSPSKETRDKIKEYYGIYSIFIAMFKPLYILTPSFIVKLTYFLLLVRAHGFHRGKIIYRVNVNRAYSDKRQTGFTEYR